MDGWMDGRTGASTDQPTQRLIEVLVKSQKMQDFQFFSLRAIFFRQFFLTFLLIILLFETTNAHILLLLVKQDPYRPL